VMLYMHHVKFRHNSVKILFFCVFVFLFCVVLVVVYTLCLPGVWSVCDDIISHFPRFPYHHILLLFLPLVAPGIFTCLSRRLNPCTDDLEADSHFRDINIR
jgi:hypothetical protein